MPSVTFLMEAILRFWEHLYVYVRKTLCWWSIFPYQEPVDTEELLLRTDPNHSLNQSFVSVRSDHNVDFSDVEPPTELAHIAPLQDHAAPQHQIMYIMRHGHRQDELDRDWSLTAKRPWDPPLSALGHRQAREAGVQLKGPGITRVVTSPFVRCLQTSAEIVSELGLKQGQWVVHWGLSEVCGPRQMHEGRVDVGPVEGSSLSSWMWQGEALQDAVTSFLKEEQSRSQVSIRPELLESSPPTYPESMPDAFQRYMSTIQDFMAEPGSGDLLLVTHGEAVGRAVTMFETSAVVYEVNHTGYARLRRIRAPDGSWQPWQLDCQSAMTGVSWFLSEAED